MARNAAFYAKLTALWGGERDPELEKVREELLLAEVVSLGVPVVTLADGVSPHRYQGNYDTIKDEYHEGLQAALEAEVAEMPIGAIPDRAARALTNLGADLRVNKIGKTSLHENQNRRHIDLCDTKIGDVGGHERARRGVRVRRVF